VSHARVKERPINFTGPLVRAILEGRKTQTRRPLVPQPVGNPLLDPRVACKLGAPGDRLWVRRRFRSRAHSPALLEIVSRRLERLHHLRRADALAEGFEPSQTSLRPIGWFRETWDSFYASKGLGWSDNPWVWVIEFRVLPRGSVK
jgi:hypothetical protein